MGSKPGEGAGKAAEDSEDLGCYNTEFVGSSTNFCFERSSAVGKMLPADCQ